MQRQQPPMQTMLPTLLPPTNEDNEPRKRPRGETKSLWKAKYGGSSALVPVTEFWGFVSPTTPLSDTRAKKNTFEPVEAPFSRRGAIGRLPGNGKGAEEGEAGAFSEDDFSRPNPHEPAGAFPGRPWGARALPGKHAPPL